MGRAKILWSQVRDCRVDVSKSLFKYTIPTIQEHTSGEIGKFIKSEKQDGFIVLYYQRIIREEPVMTINPLDPFKMTF